MRRSTCCARNAFTLIEVIASLLLIGTLLVAVLVGHRRIIRQARLAQERIAAVETLDRLLRDPEEFGVDPLVELEGRLPGEKSYQWKTTLRRDAQAARLGAVIVRVELFAEDKTGEPPLAHVELLQPDGNSFNRIGTDAWQ